MKFVSWITAIVLLTVGTLPAIAETGSDDVSVPHRSMYVGLFLGGNLVLDDWDINALEGDGPVSPDHSALFGLRLGFQVTHWFSAEIGLGILPYDIDDSAGSSVPAVYQGGSGVALAWAFDGMFHFLDGRFVPFASVGLGAYHNVSGPLGDESDFNFHWGLGMRAMLTDRIAARLDVRHMMTDSRGDAPPANNLEITIGVDIFAWVEESAPKVVVDTDGDGIGDSDDNCPKVKGHDSGAGCPDRDGDTVLDSVDRCPDTVGTAILTGCPDTDSDGVADIEDKCPKIYGPGATAGCPLAADTDGDGITNLKDLCVAVPGPAATRGCPDTDGDSIHDGVDKCPKQPGIASEAGCMPADVAKFSGAIKGIYFATNSARIKKKSYKVLVDAAAVLKKATTVNLEIQGHTDDRGSAKANQRLSQARANSVKAFLVKEGVAAKRLVAKGYGESKPIASNKTKTGRASNRRIEFQITSGGGDVKVTR